MKTAKWLPFLLIASLLFFSCKMNNRGSYSIKDFNKSLQPHLVKIVSKGILDFDSSINFIKEHATDKELTRLTKSEHPILRAEAFRALLDRPSINHFDLIMNHLDDTAFIIADRGEWGELYGTISDDIIEHAKWKTNDDKNKTIDLLITKHNYLKSAYVGLLKIEMQEKYYGYVKEMAQRERTFKDVEYALYALAKFRKKQDIQIIKDLLIAHNWEMSELSFALMEDYPNEIYMEVFKKYYPRNFYRSVCRDQSTSKVIDFFKSLVSYKTDSSAKMLNIILNKTPFMLCPIDTGYLKEKLIYLIWNNQCKAYSGLRKQIKGQIEQYEKEKTSIDALPVDSTDFPKKVDPEPISWQW